jgi:hypothetical protein
VFLLLLLVSLCLSLSFAFSLFLSFFSLLHTLLQHRLTTGWNKSIFEFCGSWNERKSQSILMKHAKLICVMALSTTLLLRSSNKIMTNFHNQC